MSHTFQRSFHRFFWLSGIVLAGLLVAASFASAATNSTQNDITIRINDAGGTARDITMRGGSSYQFLTINDANIQFNLLANEEINLNQSDGYIFESDSLTNVTLACQGEAPATAKITRVGTTTITMRSDKCAPSGGGGGTESTPAPTTTTTSAASSAPSTTTTTTTTTTTAAATTTTPPTTTTTPSVVTASAPTITPPPVSPVFKSGLNIGMTNADVKRLQTLLATDSALYPEGITSGYFGSLTKAAVGRFQMKYDLVTSASDSGYGYVGPKTRAKLQEVYGGSASAPSTSSLTPAPAETTDNAGVNSLKAQIDALQKMLDQLKAQ